ncbi:MAG: hypothetical protein AB7O56_14080 [Bauldia sp.]
MRERDSGGDAVTSPGPAAAPADLLREIQAFCRRVGIAETTFGRLAVNDGKLVARLRAGGAVTAASRARIEAFMRDYWTDRFGSRRPLLTQAEVAARGAAWEGADKADVQRNFRFFDNRQKYLLFVNTCSEKAVIADRVAAELRSVEPRPPALRLFDAGVGDGTVLSRVLRAAHDRFPLVPFYVVGKEISWEDIRLTLDKMPDRFMEHPATALVLTNLYYREAPWLTPRPTAERPLVWKEVGLTGSTAHAFEQQITDLQPQLSDVWRARVSATTGVPAYERPVVLVLYRADHRFMLEGLLPRPPKIAADFDLVIASQPYRAKASDAFKVHHVLAPLVRALGPGGRLLGVHSYGSDPGFEIIERVWPDEPPIENDRHRLLKALKQELGADAGDYLFSANSDARSLFRFDMHTLPGELVGTIGTSTLFAAWNAAIYVAQVEDDRLEAAVKDGRYLDATAAVLRKHGGLWFNDESFIVTRRHQ